MKSRKHSSSSSSEEDHGIRRAMIADEKKRKRMLSNRESARRSRMKKEQHIKDLNDKVAYFRTRSSGMVEKITEISRCHMAVESENRMLRTHGEELKRRLEFLQGVLASYKSFEHANGVGKYSEEHSLMRILQEPWVQQPHVQSHTIDGIYMF
ncbi:bZIP transcription factor 53-like [Andrographis paniculata]|uniref:bZIP transcription factor 53-like n=1 Tax=Andrographis paniculata TaxID=175694 RepID=UPI0021E890BD|nr:bZIP transcription factor 53-like [Andrographis paniculata]